MIFKPARLGVFLALFLFLSSPAYAAFEWKGPFTIKEITHRAENSLAVLTVAVDEINLISSGCPISDQEGFVSYWASTTNGYHSQWNSMLMASQAQGKKVMLFIDSSTCSTWAGARFFGVKILPE
ncbi:MAG: hypothetical protein R3E62_10010 [Pseudomonadales bacterium]